MTSTPTFRVYRNRGMSIAWAVAGMVVLAFALLPWVWGVLIQGATVTPIPAALLGTWSAFPAAMSVVLLYAALCRNDLVLDGDDLHYRSQFLVLRRGRRFREVERVYLLWRLQRRKSGNEILEVIYIRSTSRNGCLIDESQCSDIAEVYRWLRTRLPNACRDLRNRKVFG